jgi:transposase-like protein
MLKLIREALKQDNNKLRDVVEVDAEVIGGVSTVEKRMANKTKIMVAIQRNGEIRAKVVPDHSSETHRKFIEENIEKGSILLTDNALHYKNSAKGFDRLHVNHSKGEYARNGVHINSVETFFAHLKRSLKGVHKTISPEHLQSYLDGFVFQRNNAYSDK